MSFSVIIPSRNAANLVPCMEAVRKHEPGARIIMVDDGVDWSDIGWAHCDVEFLPVRGVQPFIFARNVNLGIRAAGDDDVIVLNDDALLETPFGFTAMWEAAKNNPEYGLIGATCNNVGNPNQRRIEGGGIYGAGVRGGALDGLRDEPRMICFVAVLIPRRTIETVGLLDEEFVHYGCEDDSYCLRVRRAGLKIGIHDGCYVDHGSLSSSFRGDAGAGGDFRPNLKIFIEKYGVDNRGQSKETSHFPELFPEKADSRNAA